MKVRAIEGCHRNLTAGKIYDVVSISEGGTYWRVVDDSGNPDGFREDNFKVVEDEPKIEVGSLWIHDNGLEYEVTAVGETKVLVKLNGDEFLVDIVGFGNLFNPKPKTVTMYFYKMNNGEYESYSWKIHNVPFSFKREIELP